MILRELKPYVRIDNYQGTGDRMLGVLRGDGCYHLRSGESHEPDMMDWLGDGVTFLDRGEMAKQAPVYVDPLMVCLMNARWRWPKSCHMFVDPETPLEVLHEFAAKIGLKRAWFQSHHGRMPHYDLNERRRSVAVQNGAVETDRRKVVDVIRFWRAVAAE